MSFVQGEHTISYHKDLDGWIPASRILQMNGAGSSVITLDRLAQPTTGTNYLMAKIPIKGSLQHFYTVEARRQVGYDITIPGNAVIIHDVLTTRTEPAHVVDVDNNGNPNDAGAMWNAGETFNDPANGVTVAVVSETATTTTVVITLSGAASELTVFGTLAGTAGPPDVTDGTGAAARFNTPFGLAANASGDLFVADEINHTIRKISRAGVVTTFIGHAAPGVPCSTPLVDGSGSAARLCYPAALAIDGSGVLYVADAFTIRKVTPAGAVTTIAGSLSATTPGNADGTGSAAQFNFPTGLAVDSSGTLYVADTSSHTIRKITAGGVVTTFAGAAGVSGSADGTGTAARFKSPRGLAIDSTGQLYVADQGNLTIRRITPAGVVTTLAGSALNGGLVDGTGSAARFLSPYGVAIDRSGNIDIADYRTVRRVTPAGVVTTLAGSNGAGGAANGAGDAVSFTFLGGIAVDAVGTIYAADGGNNTIRASISSNQLTLSPVALKFGGTANASGALTSVTPAQTIAVAITSGTAWTAAADQPWVSITGGSQTGSGTFQVAIVNPGNVLAGLSNVTATHHVQCALAERDEDCVRMVVDSANVRHVRSSRRPGGHAGQRRRGRHRLDRGDGLGHGRRGRGEREDLSQLPEHRQPGDVSEREWEQRGAHRRRGVHRGRAARRRGALSLLSVCLSRRLGIPAADEHAAARHCAAKPARRRPGSADAVRVCDRRRRAYRPARTEEHHAGQRSRRRSRLAASTRRRRAARSRASCRTSAGR